MTTRDIESHVKEIYFGLEMAPTAISSITEKILNHAKEWQPRPLHELYPVVFFDAIHYKVRVDSNIVCKAAYTCLGIDKNGLKHVTVKWTTPKWNWGQITAQLSIHFEERVELDLI